MLPKDMEQAVRYLARFHATWWNNPKIHEMLWLHFLPHHHVPNVQEIMENMRNEFMQSFAELQSCLGNTLPKSISTVAQNYWYSDDNGREERPYTLVHGDYLPINIAFPSHLRSRFAIFDWEFVHKGCGEEDLARFITIGLKPQQRQQEEKRLVRLYYKELKENGIYYDFDEYTLNYKRGLLYSLFSNIVAARSCLHLLENSNKRDALLEIYFTRLDIALREHCVLELLPP